GRNYAGQLGNGSTKDSSTPVAVRLSAKPLAPAAPKKAAPKSGSATALRAVAGTIETDLAQLASGRATLKAALTNVSNCSISPAAAVAQVASVIVNRQHVLAGLSRLATPTAQAARVGSLLRQALTYSIAADRHYRQRLLGGTRMARHPSHFCVVGCCSRRGRGGVRGHPRGLKSDLARGMAVNAACSMATAR